MHDYPIPKNEQARLRALRHYEILRSLREDEFDRITELASLVCDMPISLVSLIEEHKQWFKSTVGLDAQDIDRTLAFCQYTIMEDRVLEIEDASVDERFKEYSLVKEGPKLRFYAGVPLIDPDGYALGTICVIDYKANKLTEKQKRVLQLLSQEVMKLIQVRWNKEKLRSFERLFHFSNDLICIAGGDGYFKEVNPAFEQLLSWKASELLSTPFIDLIHPDDRAKTEDELVRLQQGQPTVNFVVRVGAADKSFKSLQWTVTPELSTDNLFAIGRDVTPLLLQQQELETARLQAEQASLAKSEFVANMSHEIRTPLNAVIGFTDLVLKTSLSDVQQQYLSLVNQSASTLLGIINDILDFSKIEAGKLELSVEKCDLRELGAEATDIITYQVETKGVEILLNIQPELPRFIWADNIRLKQVLVNLLSNAAKFTERGEIELKIDTLEKQADDVTLRFSVRDTGVGIQPERQAKIFDAFTQEDASTTKKYGGTGLGLTISNRLLQMMDSRLQLKSTPGKGSIFFFDLQVKGKNGEPESYEGLEYIGHALIVDDNDNNRLIVEQMLLLKEIRSTQARNGLEALELLGAGQRFDVVLMDYHMPYMDGLETIRKIREQLCINAAQLPVMLLHSSSDDEKVIRASEQLQVSQRLVKPVKMQDLYAALSRLHKRNKAVPNEGQQKAGLTLTGRYTILVAEDNRINMLLTRKLLERITPNSLILEARNGLEAVAVCRNRLPDLILMDVQMPEMNGYEAVENIRQLPGGNNLPIIALTAGSVASEREKAFAAGMDDFIVKPVAETTLASAIRKWLKAELSIDDTVTPVQNVVHFDITRIYQYAGNDRSLVEQMIPLAITELRQTAETLQLQLDANDIIGLQQAGHRLYGTASAAGLPHLALMARKTEEEAKQNNHDLATTVQATITEIHLVIGLMNDANII